MLKARLLSGWAANSLVLIMLLGCTMAAFAAAEATDAEKAIERMRLIGNVQDKLDDISQHFREFDADKDADAIDKISDRLGEIEGLIKDLGAIYQKDKNAKALVEDYPDVISDFRESLGQIKLARANQFKVDPIAEICEEEEDDLRDAVNKLLAKEDPSESDEIEDLAEDTEDKVSKLMKDSASLVVTVDRLLRQAKAFNYRKNNWSRVDAALDASADKIIAYQKTALQKAEQGCKDLLLGDAQDFVEDAIQELADLDQVADQRSEDFADLRKQIDTYLKEVNKIKKADETMLAELIKAICGSDIERNGDTADKLADSITSKAQRKLKPSIDYIILRQREYIEALRPYLQAGSGSPQFKQAGYYRGLLRKNQGTVDKLEESVVHGANNPRIRAASEHGKDMHERMGRDSKYSCDAVEVVAGRGRADCVSIDIRKHKSCVVWEFKPSTYSNSKAMSQARAYIPYVNKKYENNPDAAGCFPKGFEAKVASYPACRN